MVESEAKGMKIVELTREDANQRFADRASALKRQKDVTLREISEETKITVSALHGYLEGYRRVPLKAALIIADYFEEPIENFIK